jgi:LPXTG-motif cell wall-anchored protein
VNFPSGAVSVVDSVPTIYGTTATTVTDVALGGRSLTIRDLTSRTARRQVSSSNKESVTYYFKGWTVEGMEILIPPDATVSWNDLESYIAADGEIHLKGVWEEGGRYNSATFFVRFDSAAVDTNGNITSQPTENYTPEVFNTHVGGVDTSWTDAAIKKAYEIADTTSDNSFAADQAIRALYGEKTEGLWLYDFPSDDHVFTYLKEYLANNPGKQLTCEGEVVDSNQLNHSYYAIRWYVCKLEGSSWHIDGKLVKKEGTITVDKTFGGDDTALQMEKDGFYILAENGTLDADGNFVAYPHDNPKFKEYLLVVNQNGANTLRSQYPDAQILIFDSETDSAHHYEWIIDSVELGEYWHIEEFPVDINGYSCYAEYSVYDTDGEHSAIAEYGTQASVIGKTFALDEDPDQGLMVEFYNYYYPVETILIKKEDGKTGKPIGGAVFELWQNGNRLSFNYNADTGQYERDESGNGAFTQIVTAADGFSVISTTGFSYDYGDVVVKEVLPPAGYDPAPDITVGKDADGEIVVKDIAGKPPDQWDTIAKVPSADSLAVKDYAAEYISVTAQKVWNTNTPADSVEVVLQANGQHAAALFPGMANAQVVLNAGNLWQHTWSDLPRYANGQVVQWGIKEVIIGGKPTLADGVTFANWTVTYSPGVGTDTDSDGDIDNWKFTVTNSQKRLQLILTKVGSDGVLLPGSIFSLEQVELKNGQWQPVANTAVNIQTTDANGMLTFDNLTADVYYRLAELQAADGYFISFNPVVLTMDSDGNIRRVLDDGTLAELYDPVIQITGPFNIRVTNLKLTTLPETGGMGTHGYIHSGLLLMIVSAMALLLYKRKRRREGTDTS